MSKVARLLSVGILLLSLLLLASAGAATASGKDGSQEDIPEGLRLLPRIGLSLEYGGFIIHQDNYASMLRRRLEIDIFQFRRHIFYLDFDENNYFGTPRNPWEFNLLKYVVTLGGYRYDFGDFYLGLFYQHQCNNPLHTQYYSQLIERERANLYYVGLEFLTKTMRLGMKDRGINFDSPNAFEFLGRFAGGASASKVTTKENIQLNYVLKGQLRYDIFRYYCMVPYVEVTGEVLGGPVTRAVPAVEVGTRLHLSRVDITPFFKWSRDQEALTESITPEQTPFIAKNYLFAGARVETLLDAQTFGARGGPGWQLFPELHGTADYALFLQNPNFKGHGKIELDFEALRYNAWTFFLYTNMDFNTRKEDFKPDKINYWLQYGLTYAWGRYFVEGFIKDNARLDGNIYRGTQEHYNLGGLRLGTKGMKPGHFNDGISFTGPATFEFLNNWNGQASFAHYFKNRDWQYLWDVDTQVRWDACRWHFIIPYVQGELHWQSGGGSTTDVVESAVEPGLRFHGVLDLNLYYRYQHRQNVLFFRGLTENQHLVGLRALF